LAEIVDRGEEEAPVTKNSLVTRDDMERMNPDEYDRRQNEQFAVFEQLRARVSKLLETFSSSDSSSGRRDYSVHGDYSEYPQVVVFIHNLELLRHRVVGALQHLAQEFPGWQIDLMVGLREHLKDWPNMGISIRADEIVDDLQRQYLPEEFRDLTYQGSRRGRLVD
jgi:hypothetical protein